MRRKKQGASLIIVVIVFMFVFTISTAMLSMVASNYKARATESKRIENLYASDSGLDVAYTIIGKTFDAATKYGYWKVEELKSKTNKGPYNDKYKDIEDEIDELKSDITVLRAESPSSNRSQSDINEDISEKKNLLEEDENIKNILCDEEFKRAFKNFIKKAEEDDEVEVNENVPDKQLEESINTHTYVSEITSQNIDTDKPQQTIEFKIENKDNDPPKLKAEVSDPINPTESSNQVKGIYSSADGGEHAKTVTFTVYGEQYYNVSVKSTFYTELGKESNEINKRELQAQYKVTVPNYKDIYFENSSGELNQYLATKDRALTIYGDMNVNNVDGLTVNGEIFVNGSDDRSSTDRVYGKYFGGITLNNSDSVSFEDNVITRGTFNIQNTTTSASAKVTTLKKNLYARNVYVGKIENGDNGLASGLSRLDANAGEVIINNDLALNANNATINIKNFYGIRDENISSKAQSSSSIIVNGNNNSAINISESAYLMGTAHIATEGDYQTAESGAVKGNYMAYSIPLTDEEKAKYGISLTEPEEFIYDKPLQLLDPNPTLYQNAKTDQDAKEKHFIAYWNEDGKNPNSGGINWPAKDDGSINSNNIWSIGVIVYETNDIVEINGEKQKKRIVIPAHYTGDLELKGEKIYTKREEFAKYVYKFGETANITDYNNTIYTEFNLLIDTSKIPSEYTLSDQENKGEYAIFNNNKKENGNKDEYKEIRIIKSNDDKDRIISNSDSIEIQVAKKDTGYTLNAVIATAGKVSIDSDDIILNGCIIAEGDLDVNGNNVKIKYDSDVIERLQAQNFDTFKAVFGESIMDDTDTTTSTDSASASNDAANYELKNFLEKKLWKILK